MTTLQRMREQLGRELVRARTRREEHRLGQSLVENAEMEDFREFAELRAAGSVRLPHGFTLLRGVPVLSSS